MKELFQSVVMRLALCGLAASLVLLLLRSRPVRGTFVRLLSVWRSLTAFGRVAACSFLLVGILIGGDKTNSVPPNVNSPLPQIMQGGIIQGGAASCRAGDLRNDSFIWRGGTPHLLGTEFIANVGAGLLAPGGGGEAGLAAECGVEVLRARESARA